MTQASLLKAMKKIDMPAEGVAYEPGIDSLEACGIMKELGDNAFGGMPIELGMCWGYNKALNCLEYHRNSEINIGATDFVLLLAKQEKIVEGKLNTADVKALRHLQAQLLKFTLHHFIMHHVW